MGRLTILRGLAACAPLLLASGVAFADVADNNDYYTTTNTALLRSVQRYHVLPAEEKLRTKYYSSARQDIDFILKYFPNHPQGLLLMVQLCSEPGARGCDLDSTFDDAIAVNPNVAGTYVTKGIYLHRIKRYNDAIKAYQQALTLDPDSMNAHYNLGLAYVETKQYDLANAEAKKAYALGAPLSGLRERLKRAGQWQPGTTASP